MADRAERIRIGIKYCGGCRAGYERTREVTLVKQALEPSGRYIFEHAAPDSDYDFLLVAAGCGTACPDLSPYTYKRVVTITAAGGGAVAADEIVKGAAK